MKKIYSIILIVIFSMIWSSIAFAQTSNHVHDGEYNCCQNIEDGDIIHSVVPNKPQIIVEVSSEEEMMNYSRNSEYRYKFIIAEPIVSRAVCYMCGRATMGTATVKEEEWAVVARSCPLNQWGVLDHFITDNNYRIERCTACGYEAIIQQLGYTYRAICRNTDIPDEMEWEVREGWYMSDGYDIHQVYDYWVYGIMARGLL